MNIYEKEKRLVANLRKKKHIAIAFSGGVDSTYLLSVAKDVEGLDLIAITARSPLHAIDEGDFAEEFGIKNDVKHRIVEMPLLDYKEIRENSPLRCYHCKKVIFSAIKNQIDSKYILADGTNLDDFNDYRPGLKACDELSIWHPLAEVNLTKKEIYQLSEIRNLETSSKPPFACLASRVPYGTFLTKDNLRQVYEAEKFIESMGFRQYRVRHHGEVARIELLPKDIDKLLEKDMRNLVVNKLKSIGFSFVALDLKGYTTGSMNVNLDK